MIGWRRLLGVVLAGLWLVNLACAETAVAPGMHCQGTHMPCCPRSGGAQCASVQCVSQVFQKSDSRNTVEALAAHCSAARQPPAIQPSPAARSAVTSGLLFRSSVFRLKDDLRV